MTKKQSFYLKNIEHEEKEDQFPFDIVSWDDILKENKHLDFVMTEEQIKQLMERLGDQIDNDGYLYDEAHKKIKSINNEEVKYSDTGAILSCCKVIVNKDIFSFAQYVTKYCK